MMARDESPFDTFLARHMNHMPMGDCYDSKSRFKEAAICANDTLFIARLICQQQFETDTPDPLDVIAIFNAILSLEQRVEDRVEREAARDASESDE